MENKTTRLTSLKDKRLLRESVFSYLNGTVWESLKTRTTTENRFLTTRLTSLKDKRLLLPTAWWESVFSYLNGSVWESLKTKTITENRFLTHGLQMSWQRQRKYRRFKTCWIGNNDQQPWKKVISGCRIRPHGLQVLKDKRLLLPTAWWESVQLSERLRFEKV